MSCGCSLSVLLLFRRFLRGKGKSGWGFAGRPSLEAPQLQALEGAGSERPPSKVPFKGGLKGPSPGKGEELEAPLKPFSTP